MTVPPLSQRDAVQVVTDDDPPVGVEAERERACLDRSFVTE